MKKCNLIIFLLICFIGYGPVIHAEAGNRETILPTADTDIAHLLDLYMTETFLMLKDDELKSGVAMIVNRISGSSEQPDIQYIPRIMNDPLPLAVSFPGYLYVSTGMLDIVENESELAYVIAHAIAHSSDDIQNRAYMNSLKKSRIAMFTGSIMPLLVFSGLGGSALAAGGVSAASVAAFETVLLVESGIYSFFLMHQSSGTKKGDGTHVIHNRLVPQVQLPDDKAALSVMVFINDVFTGYGKQEETGADRAAIRSLERAGYDVGAATSLMKRLMEKRSDFVSDAMIFHGLVAKPGLEKRITHAEHILENNR